MSEASLQAEWYYVGHYGQLGPLTLDQMKELAADGVVVNDTYVWRSGMSDWSPAEAVADLRSALGTSLAPEAPPPSPLRPPPTPVRSIATASAPPMDGYGLSSQSEWQYIQAHAPKSDKSRVAGGVLNILLPGVGRLYLGYAAHGVLQIFFTICTLGFGAIWPFIDGIYILAGGVKLDGYGRRLED
jgi:hypothetical protein